MSEALMEEITEFAATHAYLQLSENAAGECYNTSYEFRQYSYNRFGLEIVQMEAEKPEEVPEDLYTDHYAVFDSSSSLIIDFTMRQFYPDCDFPLICDRVKWSAMLDKAWNGLAVLVP